MGYIEKIIREVLFENYGDAEEYKWFWISPENNIIIVPKLNHRDYIMRKYKDSDFGWDYDMVFKQALEDGWVRGIYEYWRGRYSGEINITTKDEMRAKYVLNNLLSNYYSYRNMKIYINIGETDRMFSTHNQESKAKFYDWLL